jgi:hypothetical protein
MNGINLPQEKPLVFVHIPKTAGTSFRRGIESVVGPERLLKDYGPQAPETSDVVSKSMYGSHEQPERLLDYLCDLRIAVLAGHFHIRKYFAVFGQKVLWCTFVRDPIQRVVSEYNHFRNYHGYSGTFEQFRKLPIQCNLQSALLAGVDIPNFFFVGITERYEESIRRFNHLTGWEVPVLRENTAPAKPVCQLTLQEHSELMRLNRADLVLYLECWASLDELVP